MPTSQSDIRLFGGGRYLIEDGQLLFSSTENLPSRTPTWVVRRGPYTERCLQFVSRLIGPTAFERRPSLLQGLKAAIDSDTKSGDPPPLQPGDTVVVLTHALPPGGAERQWCYLAGELTQMGYDVHFVTLFPLQGDNGHYLGLLNREAVKLIQLADRSADERELLANLHSRLEAVISAEVPAGILNLFGTQLHDLIDLFSEMKPRAVFAQLDSCNLIAATAALLTDVPQVVVSFRNYHPNRFSYLANDWFQPLYSLLARSSRVLFAGNSRAANADYAHWIGIEESRVALVPNAIDATTAGRASNAVQLRRQLGLSAEAPVILGVFRLSEEKRPILFVDVFAAVLAQIPNARAFVAGVGPLEQAVRRRIDELGLQSSLTLLGRRDDVDELMQISSLLLLVSHLEGMPNVVMEAQAVGTPVVASNVGGVPDCMIDGVTGYLVESEDVAGFARRCVELLRNKELRNRFGANAAAYMRESFSRSAMATRYVEVLGALVNRSSKGELRVTAA